MYTDPIGTARQWRELGAARSLSLREVIIEVTGRQNFIGAPETVAGTIDEFVQADATEGRGQGSDVARSGDGGFGRVTSKRASQGPREVFGRSSGGQIHPQGAQLPSSLSPVGGRPCAVSGEPASVTAGRPS
jgi:hypothetical protein